MGEVAKSGQVAADDGRKQHVDLYRKVAQRRRLLATVPEGAVYLPFCGDGDIAAEVYRDRTLWAADLDPDRVDTFRERFPDASVTVGDCDGWPFGEVPDVPFAVGDFDSYSYPYHACRSFLEHVERTDPFLLLFTDGQLQALVRQNPWRDPDGTRREASEDGWRRLYNTYWSSLIEPWLGRLADELGTQVVATDKYRRGNMLYWGAVLGSRGPADVEGRDGQVQDALHEAAVSGNVPAIEAWMKGRSRPDVDGLLGLFDL